MSTTTPGGVATTPPVGYVGGKLICPHCAEPGRIVQFDAGCRSGPVILDGDQLIAEPGDADWETDFYRCDACGGDVDLGRPVDAEH